LGNESEEGEETQKAMSRRKLLGLAAAAAAGLALTPLTEKAHAASGDPLLIGEHNEADLGDRTLLDGEVDEFPDDPDFPAIFVVSNKGLGQAIVGKSKGGPGIGVQGLSASGIGVLGESPPGMPPPDIDIPVGVHGRSSDGIGVHAVSETGTALKVDGKSFFDTTVDGGWPPHLFGGLVVLNDGSADVDGNWPNAIVGHCENGIGVLGDSTYGHGVLARSMHSVAMKAHSDYGTGVVGTSTNGGIGVHAVSETGTALQVDGKSNFNGEGFLSAKVDGGMAFFVQNTGTTVPVPGEPKPLWPIAMFGGCDNGCGLFGRGGTGVQGESTATDGIGAGVYGTSTKGHGVQGVSEEGIGVLAQSPRGTALQVEGKSSFSTVGSGTIPAFKKSYTVGLPAGLVTDKSHISVTLTSDPNLIGEDAAVSFVERDPANNRFTINLTKAVGRNTTFTYFIVEP